MDGRQEKAKLIFAAFALGILAGVSLTACIHTEDEGVKALTGMFAVMAGTGTIFAGIWAFLISPRNQS